MDPNNRIVLAFDIERTGGTNSYDTIAIGASVVDHDYKLLDQILLKGYFPKEQGSSDSTPFEEKCWNEFWSKNTSILETLTYEGPLSRTERQKDMIEQFQAFRSKWEGMTDNLYLVSDNNVYDGGFINDMIYKYMPGTLPIPYKASTGEYSTFFETYSQQKGLLLAVDPEFQGNWGLSDRIKEVYAVHKQGNPYSKCKHDHNPANDAYSIAVDQQVLFAIKDRRMLMAKEHEEEMNRIQNSIMK